MTQRNLPSGCFGTTLGSKAKKPLWRIFHTTLGLIAERRSRFKAIVAAHDFLQDLENKSGHTKTT